MKNYYVVHVDSIGEVGETYETYEEADEYHSKWLNDISTDEERKNDSYIIELNVNDRGNVIGSKTIMYWSGDHV